MTDQPPAGTPAEIPADLGTVLKDLAVYGFPIARLSKIPSGPWIVGAYDKTPGKSRLAHGEGLTSADAARAALVHAQAGGEPIADPLDIPELSTALDKKRTTLTPMEEEHQQLERKKAKAKYRRERPDPARQRPPTRRRER